MKKFTEWLNEQPIQSPAVRPRPEAAESARISSALRNLIQAEIQTGLRDPSYGLSREDVIAVLEYLTEGTPPEAGQWTEPQRRFFEEVKKWQNEAAKIMPVKELTGLIRFQTQEVLRQMRQTPKGAKRLY